MKSSTDYKPSTSLAVLLVGEQKTGKTRTLFAFPDPWILDCDRNLYSAVRIAPGKKFWFDDPYTDKDGKYISDDIMLLPTKDSSRWARAYKLIQEAAKEPLVKTIVLDGWTALTEMLIGHLILCGFKDEGKKLDRLRIQDYQPLKTIMTSLIMALRNTGKIIVVTSHQKSDKDELTGRLRYTVNMPGSLCENFGGLFTNTWATQCTNNGGKLKYEILHQQSGFHVSLGTDRDLPMSTDVTDKTPDQVWAILAPKLTTAPLISTTTT